MYDTLTTIVLLIALVMLTYGLYGGGQARARRELGLSSRDDQDKVAYRIIGWLGVALLALAFCAARFHG